MLRAYISLMCKIDLVMVVGRKFSDIRQDNGDFTGLRTKAVARKTYVEFSVRILPTAGNICLKSGLSYVTVLSIEFLLAKCSGPTSEVLNYFSGWGLGIDTFQKLLE